MSDVDDDDDEVSAMVVDVFSVVFKKISDVQCREGEANVAVVYEGNGRIPNLKFSSLS